MVHLFLTDLKWLILKGWGNTSLEQRLLRTGFLGDNSRRSEAPRDVMMVVAHEMLSPRAQYSYFEMEDTYIHEVKLKLSYYNRD